MTRLLSLITLLAALTCSGQTFSAIGGQPVELITNGNFSAGTNNWIQDAGTLSTTNGGPYGDCLKVTLAANTYAFADQSFAAVVGNRYTVTVWAYQASASAVALLIGTTGHGSQVATTGNLQCPEWTKLTYTFTATAKTLYVTLAMYGVSGNPIYYALFDSVSITREPTTGTFTGSGNWYGTTNPVNGLVVWYRFNTNSGTIALDSSGYGNNGTLSSASHVFWTNGVAGGGIYCDGSGCVNCGQAGNSLFTGFTVSTWVYPVGVGSYFIAGKMGTAGNRGWQLQQYTNAINFTFFTSVSGSQVDATTTPRMPTNAWSHVAVTFNALDKVIVYTNGVLSTSVNIGVASLCGQSTVQLQIGSRGQNDGIYNGSVDDVRIYSRALNATEVLQLFNNGRPLP